MLYSVSEHDEERPTTCVGIATATGKFPKGLTWEDAGEPLTCIVGADYDEERSAIDPSVFVGFDDKLSCLILQMFYFMF